MPMHPGLQNGPIYLDYNATTPVDPQVATAMSPFLSTHFGNPSSAHAYGRASHEAIGMAREQVAQILGCAADEIVFTGSGSESDMLAIRGSVLALQKRGNHIITQVTEHPAVLNLCQALTRIHNIQVTYLPVDSYGRVNPADVEAAINERTVLITVITNYQEY